MLKSIQMAALAAAVSLTPLSFVPTASAQDMEFLIGPDGVRVRQGDFCDRNPYDQRCEGYMERRGRSGYDRPNARPEYPEYHERRGRYGKRCDGEDALSEARSMGIRHADVVRSTTRSITVQGIERGDRVRVTFGRDGNCSLIG